VKKATLSLIWFSWDFLLCARLRIQSHCSYWLDRLLKMNAIDWILENTSDGSAMKFHET
jgi:hypothetical protein